MEGNDKDYNATTFLFDLSEVVKQFYENPVVYLTRKDYSDTIFNSMCIVRKALYDSENETTVNRKTVIIDNIAEYHISWLQAVNDINAFKADIGNISKEETCQSITYTIGSMANRLRHFNKYMGKYITKLSNIDISSLSTDLEIVEEMHKETISFLQERLTCFKNFTSTREFEVKLNAITDEFGQWIDKIFNAVSRAFSKYFTSFVPNLYHELTGTLLNVVKDVQKNRTQILIGLKENGIEICQILRYTTDKRLEINIIVDKIKILEDRIKSLEADHSEAAALALKLKKEYLEKRLQTIENLRISLKTFNEKHDLLKYEVISDEEQCMCEDLFQLKIFDSHLPSEERQNLVTELCYLWDLAVFGEKSRKSVISILSAVDVKEEYSDELGTFYIDDHGRKIYKIPEDNTPYQANEHNQLVPVVDTDEHIYFYDECGRYFVNEDRQRIYKAHDTASEYIMDMEGNLLKVKEEDDGVTFYYDNYGRYYIDETGKHIYREKYSESEYETDELGNLVRIRSQLDIYQPCPEDVQVTEDFKYLKQAVGQALRECIAQVILRQPANPVEYLSACLLKYREKKELHDQWAREKEAADIERQRILEEKRLAEEKAAREAAALLGEGESEASYDTNVVNYTSLSEPQPEVLENIEKEQ